MSPLLFLAIAAAGGAGAVLRWLLSRRPAREAGLDLRIVAVNLLGSLLAGYLVAASWVPEPLRLVLVTGLCGGLTTWGTVLLVAWTAPRSLPAGRREVLTPNLVGSMLAALLGLWLGAALPPYAAAV